MTHTEEELIVRRLTDNRPGAVPVAETCSALFELMNSDERWTGACHALTTLGYVLLREQDVEVIPCIGEVRCPPGVVFDHSWLELDDVPIDVAIARTLIDGLAFAPVVFGRHLDDARPSDVTYGVLTSGLDETARTIAAMTFAPYMDGFPDHVHGLWGVASEVGANLGLKLEPERLRDQYGDVRWVLRQGRSTDDERRRTRNRRKKAKHRG
jgi:hypothetical protein